MIGRASSDLERAVDRAAGVDIVGRPSAAPCPAEARLDLGHVEVAAAASARRSSATSTRPGSAPAGSASRTARLFGERRRRVGLRACRPSRLRRCRVFAKQVAERERASSRCPSSRAAGAGTRQRRRFSATTRRDAAATLLERLRLVRDLELRNADFCTSRFARCGSSMPGSSTMMRSLPTFCTTGSDTPNSSMRLRTTLSARSIASALFGDDALGLVDLEGEVHPALQVESALERHAVHVCRDTGRRLRSRSRTLTVRGKSAQTDAATRASDDEQAVTEIGHSTAGVRRWIRGLWLSSLSVTPGSTVESSAAACRRASISSRRAAQRALPRRRTSACRAAARRTSIAHVALVQVAVGIEQVRLERDALVAERRARAQIHHPAERPAVRLDPTAYTPSAAELPCGRRRRG